jgi:hypothetical protein
MSSCATVISLTSLERLRWLAIKAVAESPKMRAKMPAASGQLN